MSIAAAAGRKRKTNQRTETLNGMTGALAERQRPDVSDIPFGGPDDPPLAGTVVRLSVELLRTMPENPAPDPVRVAEIAETIEARGQDEPIIVRPATCCEGYEVPAEHYQVMAGATRLAAVRRLGHAYIDCRIRTDIRTKRAALDFAAGNNADRRHVDEFEQAHWLQLMIAAGATQQEAGEVYHLSRGEVSNRLRMAALPEPWRTRVRDGELPYTTARDAILPYVVAPRVMAQLDESWQDEFDHAEVFGGTRERVVQQVCELASQCTGSLDPIVKAYWYISEYWPCLLDLTDPAVVAAIEPQAIPVFAARAGKIEVQSRATNHETFRRLQEAECDKRLVKRFETRDAKSDKSEATAATREPLSRAEVAARSTELQQQLADRTRKWRHLFERAVISLHLAGIAEESIAMDRDAYVYIDDFSDYLATHCAQEWGQALASLAGKKLERYAHADVRSVQRRLFAADTPGWRRTWAHIQIVAKLLWDQQETADDLRPFLQVGDVTKLLAETPVTLADGWQDARVLESWPHRLVARWLGLHTVEQLQAFAKANEVILDSDKKRDIIAAILVAHNTEGLDLPKALRYGE